METEQFADQYMRYCVEQWGRQLIQEPYGFVMFDINIDNAYIADMFIEPEFRGQGLCKKLEARVIDIALESGCSLITCKVHTSDKDWKKNFNIYTEHCGYRLEEGNGDYIRLVKEIGGEL